MPKDIFHKLRDQLKNAEEYCGLVEPVIKPGVGFRTDTIRGDLEDWNAEKGPSLAFGRAVYKMACKNLSAQQAMRFYAFILTTDTNITTTSRLEDAGRYGYLNVSMKAAFPGFTADERALLKDVLVEKGFSFEGESVSAVDRQRYERSFARGPAISRKTLPRKGMEK